MKKEKNKETIISLIQESIPLHKDSVRTLSMEQIIHSFFTTSKEVTSLIEDLQEAIVNKGGRFFRKNELLSFTLEELLDFLLPNSIAIIPSTNTKQQSLKVLTLDSLEEVENRVTEKEDKVKSSTGVPSFSSSKKYNYIIIDRRIS